MDIRLALIAPQMISDENSYKTKDRKVLPLGVYTLKSYLDDYFSNIIVIDAITNHYNEDDILRIVQDNNCNIVGISGITNRYYNSIISLSKKIKENSLVKIVYVGGALATFCYDKLLMEESIDFVIRGEGEVVTRNILERLLKNQSIGDVLGICYKTANNNCIIVNPLEKRMLVFDKFKPEKYSFNKNIIAEFISGIRSYVIMGSRGCKGNCVFCQVPDYYGERGILWRDPTDVVKEIEFAINNWGVSRINFQDSNFLCNKEWLNEFAIKVQNKRLRFKFNIFADAESVEYEIVKRLKDIGLYQVFVGIETGSPARFEKLNKKANFCDNQKAIDILKKLDIKIIPGFILFYPDSTIEEVCESVLWFNKNELVKPSMYFNKMDLWYGTKKYIELFEKNEILNDSINDGIEYNFEDKKVKELYNLMNIGLSEFKQIWSLKTSEDEKRRDIITKQVLKIIDPCAMTPSQYKRVKDQVGSIFLNNNYFGRSIKNEKIINKLIYDYFSESVKYVMENEEINESKLREYAQFLIKKCDKFEMIDDIDIETYFETKHITVEKNSRSNGLIRRCI